MFNIIMGTSRKPLHSRSCAIWSIILGCCIAIYPFLIMNSFIYSMLYLVVVTTISTFNIVNMNRKTTFFSSPLFSPYSEDVNIKDKYYYKRSDVREFSFLGAIVTLACSIFVYTIISILFGATLNKNVGATLYFSCLMTVLTIYPLTWYHFFCENISALMRIITATKLESLIDEHFQSALKWTMFGAWLGAFPIPLDWDRPWQEWPITCCAGASLGNGAIHIITGFKLFYSYFRDKRKAGLNHNV